MTEQLNQPTQDTRRAQIVAILTKGLVRLNAAQSKTGQRICASRMGSLR